MWFNQWTNDTLYNVMRYPKCKSSDCKSIFPYWSFWQLESSANVIAIPFTSFELGNVKSKSTAKSSWSVDNGTISVWSLKWTILGFQFFAKPNRNPASTHCHEYRERLEVTHITIVMSSSETRKYRSSLLELANNIKH